VERVPLAALGGIPGEGKLFSLTLPGIVGSNIVGDKNLERENRQRQQAKAEMLYESTRKLGYPAGEVGIWFHSSQHMKTKTGQQGQFPRQRKTG
jgi:hypothetical protein